MSRVVSKTNIKGVRYKKSGKWWAAWLPSFPGVYGQGQTREAAYRNLLSAMRDVVDTYTMFARKRGFRV